MITSSAERFFLKHVLFQIPYTHQIRLEKFVVSVYRWKKAKTVGRCWLNLVWLEHVESFEASWPMTTELSSVLEVCHDRISKRSLLAAEAFILHNTYEGT